MKVLFVWPNKDAFGYKPIGLSILAGIANSMGWEIRLFDTTEIEFGFIDSVCYGESLKIFKPVDLVPYGHIKRKLDLRTEFLKVLNDFKPDCLAIGVLCDEFLIASEISKISKEIYPDLPIIWGGKFPTLNPEKTLCLHHADFACVGEGLDAFAYFLDALSKNSNLYSSNNIWAKKNGKIIKNAIAPLRKDIDTLPYVNWEMFSRPQFYKPFDGNIYRAGDHMLNWGCPYSCTYCINHVYHKMYNNNYFMRRYAVERIIKELKFLKEKYKLQFFKFHDEDFLLRPVENLRELSQAYIQEINLPFIIETNPKSVTEKKVKLIKNMNCVSASIAIETGDQKLRKELLKRVDSQEDIIRAFSLFKDAGIRACSFNLLGIPFESYETYKATVELNRMANVQYPDIGVFYPFEGTELRRISIEHGFFNPEEADKQLYDRNKPPLVFKNLSEEHICNLLSVFIFYVKLPKEYEPFIRRSEKLDKIGMAIRKKIVDIYDKTVFINDGWYKDDGFKDKYIAELENETSRNL